MILVLSYTISIVQYVSYLSRTYSSTKSYTAAYLWTQYKPLLYGRIAYTDQSPCCMICLHLFASDTIFIVKPYLIFIHLYGCIRVMVYFLWDNLRFAKRAPNDCPNNHSPAKRTSPPRNPAPNTPIKAQCKDDLAIHHVCCATTAVRLQASCH